MEKNAAREHKILRYRGPGMLEADARLDVLTGQILSELSQPPPVVGDEDEDSVTHEKKDG